NSSFVVHLAGGARAFLRVYEEQDHGGALREARLLEHLARRGARTPRPLATRRGELVVEARGKPCAVFPFVEGAMVCQRAVTPAHTEALGRELARLHDAAAGAEPHPSRFDPGPLAERVATIAKARDAELAALAPALGAELAAIAAARAPLPSGVVHADVFRDNVLWQGGELAAVLDFESAATGTFTYDLAVALLAWTYGDAFEPALARALVAGYQRERALTGPEAAGLYDEARYAALRFTVTRLTDVEMRRDPAGPPPKKSFRRFRARGEALLAMGRAGFADLVGLA
ncbi:MAG: homoserine kinase, partial [Myxococcales bacterium]|nr:homoserine kinase [Myxococcales bacterium]